MEGQATPMDTNASSKTPANRRVLLVEKSVHEASTKKELVSSRETGEQTTTLLKIIPRQRASVTGKSGAAMEGHCSWCVGGQRTLGVAAEPRIPFWKESFEKIQLRVWTCSGRHAVLRLFVGSPVAACPYH